MKKYLIAFAIILGLTISNKTYSQCTINASPDTISICAGTPVILSSTGSCAGIDFYDNFNSGSLASFWLTDPLASFTNPCNPDANGSTYLWFGPTATCWPRQIITQAIDVSSNNCQISFYMKYGAQSNMSPCEGPDLLTEGVRLQYSIVDSSGPWVDINFWDPNGGNDPMLTNWNYYSETVPAAAATSNTYFRWYQEMCSASTHDHWGLEDVRISCVGQETVSWSHGPTQYSPINPVFPTCDSMYIVSLNDGIPGSITVYDTVLVYVDPVPRIFNVTGGGSYPQGGSGVTVGLDSSESDINYNLILDGSYTGIVKIGTGSALDFGLQTLEGTYRVDAESNNGYCTEPMNGFSIVSTTNSILENNTIHFNLYPNPTNGKFTVKGENIELISISDVSGKVIFEKEVKEDIIEIDLSSYPKAMYFVKVYTESAVGVEKIIME